MQYLATSILTKKRFICFVAKLRYALDCNFQQTFALMITCPGQINNFPHIRYASRFFEKETNESWILLNENGDP